MAISEKIQLLGQNLYKDIPNELTLKSIPTASELDYVGSEDFDDTMLTKILPSCIEEPIDPKKLLEIDYQWVLRCLRFINYGYYANTGAILCDDCQTTNRGEYMVDLRSVACKPLPPGFKNELTIPKTSFLDYDKDIVMHLPTIQDILNSRKDKQFKDALGRTNRQFARMCYMITSIGGQKVDPVAARLELQKNMESADYMILKQSMQELDDYGLRGGGTATCPTCGNQNAAFIAFIDERFFRPTVACLRRWREDRDRRNMEVVSRTEATEVRTNNR